LDAIAVNFRQQAKGPQQLGISRLSKTLPLVLHADKEGRVELSLNNFKYHHPVEGLTVTNGQRIVLAVTIDLQSGELVIYANGARIDKVLLPTGFVFDVMNDAKWKKSDKVFTFTNYADAGTFEGLVAGLLTFNSVLSDNQIRLLFPRH
jgi:hypothetical protein